MITVRELGPTAYADALHRMRRHVAQRVADRDAAGDELWLTEHPAVYTLGFASRPGHLRNPGTIPVIETERGGQVTYHGPGQVIAYTLLDLRRRKLGVRDLVCRLEEGIIRCLAGYGIVGERRPGAPGIYVRPHPYGGAPATDVTSPMAAANPTAPANPPLSQAPAGAKIASIGLKVSRGLTWHGVAVNGRMDLAPFSHIDPCG